MNTIIKIDKMAFEKREQGNILNNRYMKFIKSKDLGDNIYQKVFDFITKRAEKQSTNLCHVEIHTTMGNFESEFKEFLTTVALNNNNVFLCFKNLNTLYLDIEEDNKRCGYYISWFKQPFMA